MYYVHYYLTVQCYGQEYMLILMCFCTSETQLLYYEWSNSQSLVKTTPVFDMCILSEHSDPYFCSKILSSEDT